MGHLAGVKVFKQIVETCGKLGIRILTAYAFSKENWRRSSLEVGTLLHFFQYYSRKERESLVRNNVCFRAIGDLAELPEKVLKEFRLTEEATKDSSGLILNLAVNYGARAEILEAVRNLARKALRGELDPEKLDENILSEHLYTAGLPDPDLLIRTSGEIRVSNFLLWQIAYTEFYFTPLYWPDFSPRELLLAIRDFQKRERRFGGTRT